MGLVYFLLYLFLEILVSYFFMKLFSPLGFFIETVVTALIGAGILREAPLTFLGDLQRVIRGELQPEEAFSIGMFRFIGAILLIIPGFLTDIIGFLMLFEFTGQLFANIFLKGGQKPSTPTHPTDGEIIDVEVIEEKRPR